MKETNENLTIDDLGNLVGELRMMARGMLSNESRAHTYTPTALAMTALRRIKLKDQVWEDIRWENRAHFFSALSQAMRHALIDHARRRQARNRDKVMYFPPDEALFQNLAAEAEDRPDQIIRLEEAVAKLENHDKPLAEVLHQYYYLGLSIPEMAGTAGVSEKTIDRKLLSARTVLRKLLEENGTA